MTRLLIAASLSSMLLALPGAAQGVSVTAEGVTQTGATENKIGQTGFTTVGSGGANSVSLELTDKGRTTATLTLKNFPLSDVHPEQHWWYRQTHPSLGTCTHAGTDPVLKLTGLTKNTSYTYKAYRYNNLCGSNGLIATVYFKTLPSHVLEAGSIKQTEAKLTLVNANIAWSYKRTKPSAGTCSNVAQGTVDATVTGLTANSDYTFTAYRDGGCDANKLIDWVDFKTLPNPPAAPTQVSATALVEGAALSWTAGSDNGGAITSWKIQRKTGSTWGSWTPIPSSGASTTSHTVTGLTGGTAYAFKVRAVNRGGDGAASDESSVTTLVKPAVNLSLSPTSVAEDASATSVTVTATFSNSSTFTSDKTVTVTVGGSGTATSGTDYAAVSNFDITISKGTGSGTGMFTLTPTDDSSIEGDETISVSGSATGLTVNSVNLTLTDDDEAAVTVNDASASEGDGITFTVTLDKAVPGGLTVTPSYTNGTAEDGDYTANTTGLSFTGTANETKTFTVSTTEDEVLEANETFTVGLTVSGTTHSVTASDTGTGTINNDDAATVTVNDAEADEGESMTFTVTLSAAVQGGLTVTPSYTDVTTASGDYTANTTALSFTGTANETKTFTVSTTEDEVAESDETFTVGLTVSDAPSGVTSTDTGTGTIDDDDGSSINVTVNNASASEGDAITFTVTLSAAVQGGLTVTPSYTNGTAAAGDYTANTTGLSFTGTANETKTFTVSTTEDAVLEANETFTVGLAVSGTSLTVTSTDTGTGTINNDDSAAVTVNDASASEGGSMTFTVTLSAAVQGGLKVTPGYTNVTTASGDYTANTTALSFTGTANETKTFTVSTKEDAVLEANETFTVGLTVSDAPSGVTASDTGTGTITNDDAATVTVNDASASEGESMTFTVTLSKAVQGGLTVTPSYTDVTAASGDYTANTTALSFTGTANETKTFTVLTKEDAVLERNETFTVGLAVSGTSLTVTSSDTGTGTITNDDAAAVTVNDASASEGESMTFTVTLSKAVQGGLTVTPSYTNGTAASGDYTTNTTALTFTGTANETKTFTVSTTEDAVLEANETFTVGLAVSGTSLTVTSTDTGTGTITNDDAAAVTINDAEADEGDNITFTVTLSAAVQGGLKVTPGYANVTTASGDYTANTTALTFTGTASETKTFTVSTKEDQVVEADETFTVSLTVSGTSLTVTSTDTGTGTINDDDATNAAVRVNNASASEGNAITFTVTLSKAVQGGLTVTPSYTNGTAASGDYTANTTGLSFTGTANETKTFTVSTTEDDVVEDDETFTIGLTVSGTSLTVTSTDTGTGTINNDDNATVTVNNANADEGDDMTFTVTLSKAVQGGLTVTPSYTNGTAASADYTANTTALTFTGTAGETKTFTVSTAEDAVVEGNETFTVRLAVSNAPSGVTATATGTGTINNDDNATVTVNDAQADEGDAMTFTVTLDNAVQGGLTVTPSYTNGTAASTDYTANTTALSFSGTANETETFTVSTTEDSVVESDETFTIGLAVSNAPSGITATDTGTGTIKNDDAAPDVRLSANPASVSEGASATTITVTAQLSGNTTFATDRTVTVSVGGGTATAGTDYATVSDFDITIAAGQASGTGTFTLTPTQDNVVEGNESIIVSGTATGLTVQSHPVTLTDYGNVAGEELVLAVDQASRRLAEGASATVTVTAAMSKGSIASRNRTVNVTVGGGTATSGADYEAVPGFDITIPAGQASGTGTFALTLLQDELEEGDETIEVAGVLGDMPIALVTIVIVDDDEADVPEEPLAVKLGVRPLSVAENASATEVTVTAALVDGGAFPTAHTLTVSVGGGTATPESDYAPVAGMVLSIAAGQTAATATFTLTPVDDALVEGIETISISGSGTGLAVTGATLRLRDDDTTPEVKLSVDPARVDEAASPTTVTVTAAFANGATLLEDRTVRVSVGGGTATPTADYDPAQDIEVTIAAGRTSGTTTFTLTPKDDSVVEGDETILVSGAADGLVVHGAAITVGDNDEVPEVELTVDPVTVDEGAAATTVTVTASFSNGSTFPDDRPVTVSLDAGTAIPAADQATPGADYAAVPDFRVVVPAGRTSGSSSFTLTPKDDSVVEGDETIVVSGVAEGLVVRGAAIKVGDNDEIPEVELAVDPASVDEGAAATTVTVTASFSNGSTFLDDRPVTVSLDAGTAVPDASQAAPGTDYAAVPDFQVVVGAGRTSGTATFTLTPKDDSVVEGDETISVSGAAEGLTVHGTAITVSDDDEIPEVALDVDPAMVPEGAGATTVTVTASFSNGSTFLDDKPVTVSLDAGTAVPGADAAPGTDYAAVPDFQVVVGAGRTSGTATFTLTPTDDSVVEGDETISVSGAAEGLTVHGTAITLGDDDEIPEVNLSVDPQQVDEAASTEIVTVTASFSNGSTFPGDRTVTVSVGGGTADAGTDHFRVPDFDVTIPAGAASGTAVFTLMPMNDGVVEEDETIAVSGVSEGLTVHDAMLTLLDDDLEERERALKFGLAGIGRTIATQAVDAIGARFDAASRLSNVSRLSSFSRPAAASDGRFALDPFAVAAILEAGGLADGGVGLPGPDAHGPGMAGSALGASATGGSGMGGSALGGSALNDLAGRRMAHPTAGGLVSMALSGGQTGTGGWTLWASGARTDFSGRPGGFSVDGSMGAAFLGVDRTLGSSGVLGVAVSRNQGGVDLDDEGPWAGRVDARLTTVYPYARWSPTSGLDLWGIVGLGQGDVDLDDAGGDFRTDGRLRMAATGLRGDLARLGAVDLALRADAFTVGMEADGLAGSFEATDGQAQRVRLMLDASTDWRLSSFSRLTPSAEVGARLDGGDLERGPGMEVGGGLAFVNSRLGLDIAARGRWLAVHRDEHFGEWGGNLSIRRIPSEPNRGLSLSVEPSWGEDASGIMALWEGPEPAARRLRVRAGAGAGRGGLAARSSGHGSVVRRGRVRRPRVAEAVRSTADDGCRLAPPAGGYGSRVGGHGRRRAGQNAIGAGRRAARPRGRDAQLRRRRRNRRPRAPDGRHRPGAVRRVQLRRRDGPTAPVRHQPAARRQRPAARPAQPQAARRGVLARPGGHQVRPRTASGEGHRLNRPPVQSIRTGQHSVICARRCRRRYARPPTCPRACPIRAWS